MTYAFIQRAKRVDENQQQIAGVFKECGFSVVDLSGSGRGIPDLLIGRTGCTWLVECKMPKGKLTKAQVKFHQDWKGGEILIVRSEEEAFDLTRVLP